jgi:hypothetical protein
VKKLCLRIAFLVLGSVMAVSRVGYGQVIFPPSLGKAFGASPIPLNGTTHLTFFITNPNAGVALTGVAFTDTLPSGLVVATPNGLVNTCGGAATATAGSSTISLSGVTLLLPTCGMIVNVTGTTVGVKNNTSGNVSSTNGGTGNTATASITVAAPPHITKTFKFGAPIPLNGTTSMGLAIDNPNLTFLLVGLAFTDTLPAGLVVATPNGLVNTCGGAATAVSGSGTVSLSGGVRAAGTACIVGVDVTGTTAGVLNNSVTVTSTNGGTGNTASASITVLAPTSTPTVTPTVTPTSTPTPVPVVPTLDERGMLIFGLLVAGAGLLLLIRRR